MHFWKNQSGDQFDLAPPPSSFFRFNTLQMFLLHENLEKRFANTYKFSANDINKFILLLKKGVYPYQYVDDWEKSNKTLLPEK